MSSQSYAYLLGKSTALIERLRQHLILQKDEAGLMLIEDDYQDIRFSLNKLLEAEYKNGR